MTYLLMWLMAFLTGVALSSVYDIGQGGAHNPLEARRFNLAAIAFVLLYFALVLVRSI